MLRKWDAEGVKYSVRNAFNLKLAWALVLYWQNGPCQDGNDLAAREVWGQNSSALSILKALEFMWHFNTPAALIYYF